MALSSQSLAMARRFPQMVLECPDKSCDRTVKGSFWFIMSHIELAHSEHQTELIDKLNNSLREKEDSQLSSLDGKTKQELFEARRLRNRESALRSRERKAQEFNRLQQQNDALHDKIITQRKSVQLLHGKVNALLDFVSMVEDRLTDEEKSLLSVIRGMGPSQLQMQSPSLVKVYEEVNGISSDFLLRPTISSMPPRFVRDRDVYAIRYPSDTTSGTSETPSSFRLSVRVKSKETQRTQMTIADDEDSPKILRGRTYFSNLRSVPIKLITKGVKSDKTSTPCNPQSFAVGAEEKPIPIEASSSSTTMTGVSNKRKSSSLPTTKAKRLCPPTQIAPLTDDDFGRQPEQPSCLTSKVIKAEVEEGAIHAEQLLGISNAPCTSAATGDMRPVRDVVRKLLIEGRRSTALPSSS